MKVVNPYLNFTGTTMDAFNFYKSVFGGDFTSLVRYEDMPDGDRMSAEDRKKLMHISLALPSGTVLMGTDVTGNQPFEFVKGSNISLSIHADSLDEGEALYEKLSRNGHKTVPFGPADWGGYWGMLHDAYGVQWMVSFEDGGQ